MHSSAARSNFPSDCPDCRALVVDDATTRPHKRMKSVGVPERLHAGWLIRYRCDRCDASWTFDFLPGDARAGFKRASSGLSSS